MTLEECIRRALQSPSALSAARRQIEIAALGAARARASRLPVARANLGFNYTSPAAGAPGQPSHVAANGTHEYVGLLVGDWEIDTSGRLRGGLKRARADQDAAAASVIIAERDLRRLVTGAYYRVLLARRLASVSRDSLLEARAFETRTRQLFEGGEAARADIAKAAAQSAFLEQSVSNADLDAEVANHELASFWTADVAAPLPLVDVLDEPVPAPWDAFAKAPADSFLQRPEFTLLEAQRRGFLADAQIARADRRPQTSVTFQYGLDAPRVNFAERGYAAMFNVNVPLFDWSKAKNAARQFELQAEGVDDTRSKNQREFSKEYQDALTRIRLGEQQIAIARSQVALSQEDLRLSRIRYEGGEGPAIEVVTAQSQLAQARGNLYAALARYHESLADLAVASGK